MKVILQDYEPQARPASAIENAKPVVRKPRLRLDHAKADFRLFHAL